MEFALTARLFADAGFPDSVEGINEPSDQDCGLALKREGNRLTFVFRDAAGGKGSVVFPFPKRLTRFEVDPRAEGTSQILNGPTPYKEWRLGGVAKLDGVFVARGTWAQANLILHGRGNSCTSASDFESWTLSVKGRAIRFMFLGATLH